MVQESEAMLMITFKIDEFAPCLKEVSTGEIYDTEVIQIKRKSF